MYSLKVILTTKDGKSADKAIGSAFRIASTSTPVDPGIGEYRKVKDYNYPYGDTYNGSASEATAEFSILKTLLPIDDWLSQKIIDGFENEVTKQGGKMLHLDVYERDEHLLSKGYKIVATATAPVAATQILTAEGVAPQAIPIIVWALIIIAALGLVAIIISAITPSVRDVVWGKGGTVSTVTDILKILPTLMTLMVLGMLMEFTRGLSVPEEPKPITEAVVKGAKVVAKGVKTVAPYVGRAVKKVTEYLEEGPEK